MTIGTIVKYLDEVSYITEIKDCAGTLGISLECYGDDYYFISSAFTIVTRVFEE